MSDNFKFNASAGMKRFGKCLHGGAMYFLNAQSLRYCHNVNIGQTEKKARCSNLENRMKSYLSSIDNNCGKEEKK